MPAPNLLFVIRDGVFDCFDQITGFVKKKYSYANFNYPNISDVIQTDTTLVIATHSRNAGTIKSAPNTWVGATAFVENQILPNIEFGARINRVVFLACFAGNTVEARGGYSQVSTIDIIEYQPPLLLAGNNEGLKPKDLFKLNEDRNGWQITPPPPPLSS